MKIGIMQPYFFPYIGYWQLLNAVDKYVIYDDVNFINRGWINRNSILMDRDSKYINLQLHNASQNKLINEIEVLGDARYNNKLLMTIERCYKKAPQYKNAFPIIEKIISQEQKNLAKYLMYSIIEICKYLSIDTQIILSSAINKNNDLKSQDKIIEICNILEGDEYINAIGGQKLYSYNIFENQGIKLNFLKTGMVEYKQFDDKFVPNLSIIDVLMFNSIEEIKKILCNYEIITRESI